VSIIIQAETYEKYSGSILSLIVSVMNYRKSGEWINPYKYSDARKITGISKAPMRCREGVIRVIPQKEAKNSELYAILKRALKNDTCVSSNRVIIH